MSRRLGHLFRKKLQKVPDFARKHEESSTCPKCLTFWSRLPCFDVSVNFSLKNCKKCLIFRKTMKKRRFRHNIQRFRLNHPVSGMGQLFSKKLQKVPYFAKKNEKSPILPKCATFSSKARCLRVWVNFSAKSCKKRLISRKSMKNRRLGQNEQLSLGNHHVSAFGSTSQ